MYTSQRAQPLRQTLGRLLNLALWVSTAQLRGELAAPLSVVAPLPSLLPSLSLPAAVVPPPHASLCVRVSVSTCSAALLSTHAVCLRDCTCRDFSLRLRFSVILPFYFCYLLFCREHRLPESKNGETRPFSMMPAPHPILAPAVPLMSLCCADLALVRTESMLFPCMLPCA